MSIYVQSLSLLQCSIWGLTFPSCMDHRFTEMDTDAAVWIRVFLDPSYTPHCTAKHVKISLYICVQKTQFHPQLNMLRYVVWTCIIPIVLTFRHRVSCILGQAFHYSPENAFYIFNQQIYFIIWYLLDRASLI